VRFSTNYDPRDNNIITQTSRDVLQLTRFSTSYESKDNNRRTQNSRDLQSARFSISYDLKNNNRSTEGRQEQQRQAENASTRDERGIILKAES
jgi:hypothetical protein